MANEQSELNASSENLNPGLMLGWNEGVRPEVKGAIKCEKEDILRATELLGIPENEVDDLAIFFTDGNSVGNLPNMKAAARGSYRPEGGRIELNEGEDPVKFGHLIELAVLDNKGQLLSEEVLNKRLFHELSHMKQQTEGKTNETDPFDYNDPKKVEVAKRIARIGLGAGLTSSLGAQLANAYYGGTKSNVLTSIAEVLLDKPQAALALKIAMGTVATGTVAWGIVANRHISNDIGRIFHTLNSNEREARANERIYSKERIIKRIS